VINVQRILAFLVQHPFLHPACEEVGRAAIAFFGVRITRFFAVELQPDDVARVPLVQLVLKLRVDHVVRGAGHVREAADLGDVVSPAAKRLNLGHGGCSVPMGDATTQLCRAKVNENVGSRMEDRKRGND
jgi:hypothetical protein